MSLCVQVCIAIVVLSASGATAKVDAQPVGNACGQVSYVHAERVFISLARRDAVAVGDSLRVFSSRTREPVAELTVVGVAEHHAACTFSKRIATPRPGDRVVAIRRPNLDEIDNAKSRATPQSSAALRAKATHDTQVWQGAGAPTFAKRAVKAVPTVGSAAFVLPRSSRASLRSAMWISTDGANASAIQRQAVDLWIMGPLDAHERLRLEASLSAVGQSFGARPLRLHADDRAYVEVYRANLGYWASRGLGVSVGRLAPMRLRYAMLDGASLGWRTETGDLVSLAVGWRPNTRTMSVDRARPIVAVTGSGGVDTAAGLLTYGAATSWLGSNRTHTEGAEADVSVGLVPHSDVWLMADVGAAMASRQEIQRTRKVLDRAAVSATYRLPWNGTIQGSVRRIEESSLLSDVESLPGGYMPRQDLVDSDVSIHAPVGALAGGALSVGLAAGDARGDDATWTRSFVSPSAAIRFAAFGQLHVRAAYRFEHGYVGGHWVELGASLSPLDGMVIDIYEQAGVLLLDGPQEILPGSTTWLRAGYDISRSIRLSISARGQAGMAGTGAALEATLATRDFM